MEQWRQCGRWLIDCKVLPPNHRVVWPSAVVFDLAQALRDGVLLCQLLHNLSPGSIDLKDINFRPQMSQGVRAAGRQDADVAPLESPGTVAGTAGLGVVGRRRDGEQRARGGVHPGPLSRVLRGATLEGAKLTEVAQAGDAPLSAAATTPEPPG